MDEEKDNQDLPDTEDAPDADAPGAVQAGPDEAPDGQDPPAATARGEAPTPAETQAAVEAILFATDHPLNVSRVAHAADLPPRMIRPAVSALNARYEQAASTFRIEEVAGGFQMLTRPEYHDCLARLHETKKDTRLTQAAMETLAIVAYRQPILRADIEAIRGVACGEVLRGLMERQLIKITGRADVIGRPMLYGTTRRFLEIFGLNSLQDLPKTDELREGGRPARPEPPAEEPAEDEADGDQAGAAESPPAAEDEDQPQAAAKQQDPAEEEDFDEEELDGEEEDEEEFEDDEEELDDEELDEDDLDEEEVE